MSRIPKWKVEKAKVKVVFRLQFHATHIPHPGWDKLFVSFIPLDTGKATAKTTKANVRNGNCKWSDPLYETTRLFQDMQSRKYDEKLYKLVVAMGTSRSSLLGEATINLADFADASKPSSVSLPLNGCDSGTILHVTVQLLTSKTGFREFEQQRELSVKGVQISSGQRSHDSAVSAAPLAMPRGQLDKVNNARVRFKEDSIELPLLEEVEGSNEDYEDSAAGLDVSSNTSESLNAERNEISTAHEVDSLKSTASGHISSVPAIQDPKIVKSELSDSRLLKQGSNDWTHGWSSDYSADTDLTTAYDESNRLRVRLEGAEAAFLLLNVEAKSLQSLCEELGAETHSLAKQLAAELVSGEKLTMEVSILKSECDKFKKEIEELKSVTPLQCLNGDGRPLYGTKTKQMVDTLSTVPDSFYNQHEVKWLQGLLLLEDKVREIRNKAALGYHECGFDFLRSDFDVLQCVLQDLKRETSLGLTEETQLNVAQLPRSQHFTHGQGLERSHIDHPHPDGSHSSISCHPLNSNVDDTSMLKENMCELLCKLEDSDIEKGILTKKMDQMECYYEALIQEAEESRHQTANELENLRTEHSSCFHTISVLQNQIEKLQKDMSQQFIRFAGERHDLDYLNKELEKRAIASETALKRVRLNYAIAVDRLQKDLELLSFQVLSMYETNENLAKQAFIDTSQLFPHEHHEKRVDELCKPAIAKFHSESISRKTDYEKSMMANGISERGSLGTVYDFDLKGENRNIFRRGLPSNVDLWTKVDGLETNNIETSSGFQGGKDLEFHAEQRNYFATSKPTCDAPVLNVESNNQLLGDNIDFEETRRSLHMLQKLHMDTEAELLEMHMLNVHWEVYAQVLKEAMFRLNSGVIHMKEDMVKLAQQLKDSSCEKALLKLKLQTAFDDLGKLRMDEAGCRSNCDDLILKNHILEAKLDDVSRDNLSLTQKFTEYQSKYKSLLEERNEFEDMLKTERFQKCFLQSELSTMVEDFKALKLEFDGQSFANSELQKTVDYLQKKSADLCHSMISFSEEIDGFIIDGLSLREEMESRHSVATISHLEQLQQGACEKIIQLRLEKREIEEEREIVHCSLSNTESQILHLKQKFESELEEARMRQELSNALVQKLQLELQDVSNKLKFSLEAEENYRSTNRELSSKLTVLEIEVQQANDDSKDNVQKLLEFDNVKQELDRIKTNLMDCMQENKALRMSIESEKSVSTQLENEINTLKEDLKCARENLHLERGSREELETTVVDLTLQLKEKVKQLQELDNVKQEFERTKASIVDCLEENKTLMMSIESEKAVSLQLGNELINLKECLKCAHDNLHLERGSREELETTVLDLTLQLKEKCQQLLEFDNVEKELERTKRALTDCMQENKTLMTSIQSEKAVSIQLENELCNLKEGLKCVRDNLHLERGSREELEATVADLTFQLNEKDRHLLEFHIVKQELERTKTSLVDCTQENRTLMMSIESRKVLSVQLEKELSSLKEGLKCAHDNLYLERGSREELDATVADLTLQLKERGQQLLSSGEQKSEIIFLRKRVGDLETELQHLSLNSKECQSKLDDEISILHLQIAGLEYCLAELLDQSLTADVKSTYIRCHFQLRMEDLVDQNKSVQRDLDELHLKHTHAATFVKNHIAIEAQFTEENARLSAALQAVKTELQIIVGEREGLQNCINEKNFVIEDMKDGAATIEADYSKIRQAYEDELCQLRNILVNLEEEIDNLRSSNIELETTEVILKSKLDEQQTHVSLLEECQHELKRLREQHSELTYKLSEQTLKTEEFRNLSIHLRELKDKADAECIQARERREAEGSSLAMQDSLRIAFIKEQCETKLQEMKNQLCASQKYAEEMLLKLQTAIDQVETGKRSEASLAKRNEELSFKISDMEAELQRVVSDRREMVKAYDVMKAEMECANLSLDCCKDEKLKTEAFLQECNEERSRLRVELDLVKRLLENMASSTADVGAQNREPSFQSSTSIEEILEDGSFQTSVHQDSPREASACSNVRTLTEDCEDPVTNIDGVELKDESPILSSSGEVQHVPPAGGIGPCLPSPQHSSPNLQGELVRKSSIDKETLAENSTKRIADAKEHFKGHQRLLVSMDLLHKELERLKNDNLSLVIPLEDKHLDPALQGLQSNFSQLDKANEHLESIFPIFKELPGSGNALERVLALELELAEELQEKKKDIRFQSSFLKQHNDDRAVFQSFRDINELIKDMLELKTRNAAVETELKEMQGRYSQLSLKFAEVEGERQQLVMTLKSRSPRKL